jgi:hypothetical protein
MPNHKAETIIQTSPSHTAHRIGEHGGVRPYMYLFIEGGRAEL